MWARGGRCGPEWPGRGPRSAPAGRARGCRAGARGAGSARRAGGGERGGSAARKPGSSAAPGPLQLCSKLGLAAATRAARLPVFSSPSRPPSRTTTNSVASTWLGACSREEASGGGAPRDSSSRRLCSRLRVDSGRWYLPFPAPASGPVDRSPSMASPGAREASRRCTPLRRA